MSTQQDRTSTNKAALKWIKDHKKYKADAKFSKNYCTLHNLMHYSNARDCIAEIFNVKYVKTAHGARFFIKFEQTREIVELKPEGIMTKLILKCIENGWSMKSALKMQSKYGHIVTSDNGGKGDDIFCWIERQLQLTKGGCIYLKNAISRALKFIEGERDETVAQKDAVTSKFQDITNKRQRKTNVLLCQNS
eukprot:4215354-Ditylum_brightwellii.AAC.1